MSELHTRYKEKKTQIKEPKIKEINDSTIKALKIFT